MPSDNRFNTVVILDSIPNGELNTAKRLYDDLRDIAYRCSPIPKVEHYRTDSLANLVQTIGQLRVRTEAGEILPLLHIEAHGCDDGLALSSGEEVWWASLKQILIPLNIATRLNLMLVLASCSGGTFAKALRVADRAPIWGLIGPTKPLSAIQVQGDFGAFYRTLFETLSPSKALTVLNANAPGGLYYRTTAEGFFYKVWRAYRKEHCTPAQLDFRARRMYKKVKRAGVAHKPSVGHLRRNLVRMERESFEKFRDAFFMYDIFPEHAARFQVTSVVSG